MAVSRIETLDDARALLRDLPKADNTAAGAAAAREATLTKPPGALGRLETLSAWLCAWQRRHPPLLADCRVAVFAGNHGVAAEGVSAFPPHVTAQMVANFRAGGAAINQLANAAGMTLTVHPLAVETPTANFLHGPAMDDAECAAALRAGMDAVGDGCDLLCLGEMGIGNTTPAATLCHALYGGDAEDWVGPGTGVAGAAYDNKVRVVREGVAVHRAAVDGLDMLARLGGRELAAMAGAILAARTTATPVLLDGYVCGAAAAVLHAMNPAVLEHCQVAHVSAEPGHRRLLERLGKAAILDLGMRLGEGSGAAVAAMVLRAAVACHTGMATFAEAGVSDKD
jgi:nicotinate-nucleotide--dimethylbenzimidazole phosphoribosyltransferase